MTTTTTMSHDAGGTGTDSPDELQRDLASAAAGDRAARDRIWSKHYELLRQLAKAWFDQNWGRQQQRGEVSIGGTHIVGAAYERMRDRVEALQHGRAWFFRCFYTECMRIAIEHYRRTRRHRHGTLVSGGVGGSSGAVDVERVVELLGRLSQHDELAGQIAMLKVLESRPDEQNPGGNRGLSNQEVADLIGYSLSLVEKRWKFAKAWLIDQLGR